MYALHSVPRQLTCSYIIKFLIGSRYGLIHGPLVNKPGARIHSCLWKHVFVSVMPDIETDCDDPGCQAVIPRAPPAPLSPILPSVPSTPENNTPQLPAIPEVNVTDLTEYREDDDDDAQVSHVALDPALYI